MAGVRAEGRPGPTHEPRTHWGHGWRRPELKQQAAASVIPSCLLASDGLQRDPSDPCRGFAGPGTERDAPQRNGAALPAGRGPGRGRRDARPPRAVPSSFGFGLKMGPRNRFSGLSVKVSSQGGREHCGRVGSGPRLSIIFQRRSVRQVFAVPVTRPHSSVSPCSQISAVSPGSVESSTSFLCLLQTRPGLGPPGKPPQTPMILTVGCSPAALPRPPFWRRLCSTHGSWQTRRSEACGRPRGKQGDTAALTCCGRKQVALGLT